MSLDLFPVDQVIRDCQRFRDLLDSPVGGVILKLVEQQHYDDFKRASTPEQLQRAQAKSLVLDDVMHQLRTVISAGEREALERQKRERAEERAAEAQRPASQE